MRGTSCRRGPRPTDALWQARELIAFARAFAGKRYAGEAARG